MNINKVCAAFSALCLTGTAVLAANINSKLTSVSAVSELLGDANRNGVVDGVDATIILSYYAYISAGHDNISVDDYVKMRTNEEPAQTTTSPQTTEPPVTTTTVSNSNIKLKSGGDTFTVAVWNMDDLPRLVSNWLNITEDEVSESYYSQTESYDPIDNHPLITLKTPTGSKLRIINMGLGGGEAAEKIDTLLLSGDDLDVYYCEPVWAKHFIDNDSLTAPLSDLGFTDKDFSQTYKYADDIGHNKDGVRKGASPFISPGGFAYRSDLADEYLGIKSPAEMQSAIGSWDKFISTAQKLSERSNGNTALADTLGGMYQAYTMSHRMTDADGNITADAKEFADYAKTLWECGGVTKNSQWSDEWLADGLKDRTMGYFIPTWGIRGFLGHASEESRAKWELVQGPESFYWGGIMTIVNPATDNAADCASFIRSSCLYKESMLAAAENDMYDLPNNKEAMAEIIKTPSLSDISSAKEFRTYDYFSVLNDAAEGISFTPYSYMKQSDVEYYMVNTIRDKYIKAGSSWEETETAFKTSNYWSLIK